ncbi:SIS domain-containing protein [Bifidobacterium felsineum]|uniref:Phosphosugar isomerase n=1 Tax=Bifidobacterium felsineum TaxID=2045440 RepID=A0A2M9HL61_9BIFI|nr:SIS domain-containing protein [Bifidobacterium felsineum]MBT1163037.1 SIS domain-containing protein [Bifidobacterium felsineum]PJM77550.1 phosphosugar isomerase [Bifidobacterium felsineum]
MNVVPTVEQIIERNGGKVSEIYYVACGGSLVDMYVSDFFVRTESVGITSGWYTANEFVHAAPKRLGATSVVILCSHSGNTPETVAAAALARKAGAQTVGLTYNKEAKLLDESDYSFVYEWGDETRVHNNPMAIMLDLTINLVDKLEGYAHIEAFRKGMDIIDTVVANAEKQVEPRTKEFADKYKNETMFYVLASGASYGHAYGFSICSLMEMQWLDAAPIHSGEFFHGPFEVTDEDTPFIVARGLGRTRELDDRVLTFLDKYAKKVEIVDAKELGLDLIDDAVSEYFNPILFYSVLSKYRYALSVVHNHDLDVRRYMGKVEY